MKCGCTLNDRLINWRVNETSEVYPAKTMNVRYEPAALFSLLSHLSHIVIYLYMLYIIYIKKTQAKGFLFLFYICLVSSLRHIK